MVKGDYLEGENRQKIQMYKKMRKKKNKKRSETGE